MLSRVLGVGAIISIPMYYSTTTACPQIAFTVCIARMKLALVYEFQPGCIMGGMLGRVGIFVGKVS